MFRNNVRLTVAILLSFFGTRILFVFQKLHDTSHFIRFVLGFSVDVSQDLSKISNNVQLLIVDTNHDLQFFCNVVRFTKDGTFRVDIKVLVANVLIRTVGDGILRTDL